MISPVSGEVVFTDGLRFSPHEALSASHLKDAHEHNPLRIPGWTRHVFGFHPSEKGSFEVVALSDEVGRVMAVMLAYSHPFYLPGTPDDSERRAFHEGILTSDLLGQSEFTWGEVFCRFDTQQGKDWLILVYTVGPLVPLQSAEIVRHLYEHEEL